ncbi:Alpha/Beta hydrolase protein [Pisolithus croceorrhizus]|nr:Alpha/Beta hydrolase protein [Pisolithus croceorrhizus]
MFPFCAVATLSALAVLSVGQSITPLTTSQIDYFTPYTYYASTAFCDPAEVLAWHCGANCEANPNFHSVASGGDGDIVQYWYVGYDSILDTVITAHQGTNISNLLPILTDLDLVLVPLALDTERFPGLDSSIKVHDGFKDAQARASADVLAAVQAAMSTYESTSVTIVGHSLDSVYMPLHLPSGTTFKTIVLRASSSGPPLTFVGNQAFADYVDADLHLTHINNKEDPIPTLPPIFLGYVHPSGEVHIEDSGVWVACPGQDNASTECIVGDVPTIFQWNEANHDGPYNGITIQCSSS